MTMKLLRYLYFGLLSVSCCRYPEEIHHIIINDLDIAYAVRGPEDGKPVVLVHGNGGSHKSMMTQAKQLAKAGYRVYSPDSRGHGLSQGVAEYHYRDLAEDCYLFIKKMGLEKPALYGWSDGGIIALMIEMYHSGTCSMIALSGANLTPDCGEGFEEFKKWIMENYNPITAMMLNEPDIKPEELSAISCPALVTCGTEEMISVEHTKLIADSIPNSELVIFEGEDHGSYIKRSPKMGRLLLKWLKSHNY